jgi:transposase InsO family protein
MRFQLIDAAKKEFPVQRLCKVLGVSQSGYFAWKSRPACRRQREGHTTDSHHAFPVAPNLIDQDFAAERPNEKWGADISYVWIREGWLYLAVVIDLFVRRVVDSAVKLAAASPREPISLGRCKATVGA